MKPKSGTMLITGISAGTGYRATKELISGNYTIFGRAGKQEAAQRLKVGLGEIFIFSNSTCAR